MKTNDTDTTKPLWQLISGIDPATEKDLTAEQRDTAIRKLIARTDEIIAAEHARSVPAGERTVFWDPIERVCAMLEISRTKLSRYCFELTGLRAHERSDRVKAARLPGDLQAAVELFVASYLETTVRPLLVTFRRAVPEEIAGWVWETASAVKAARSGPFAAGFAMDLGYANISRLKKACTAAHQVSLDEMELRIVTKLVQKFFDEMKIDEPRDEQREDAVSAEAKTITATRTSQRIKLPAAQTAPYKEGGEKRPEAV
jgi:hypothetical protein